MLREYINRKIRENEELTIDLESDIKNKKNQKKELEKSIEILEDENNDGSEIFSPRSHREQNLDKLRHYREDLKKISEEIEEKLNKLSETKKKMSEYKSMLAETEKIHQEEEAYKNIDYQIKNSQPGKTEQQTDSEYIGQQNQTEQRKTAGERESKNSETDENIGQQVQKQDEKKSGNTEFGEYASQQMEVQPKRQSKDSETDKRPEQQEDGKQQERDSEAAERSEQQTVEQTENQTENRAGIQIENPIEKGRDESFNVETEQRTDKDLIQTEKKTEELEYEEQEKEAAPNAMDTKIIIQRSIDDIVKRIESGEDQNFEKSEQEQNGNLSQKYEMEQADKNDVSEKIQMRNDLDGIEIKSGELIVLESERKKEKEFLEKVKKGLDLCFVYSGNRTKCRNELKKVRRMIEDYIFSIQ